MYTELDVTALAVRFLSLHKCCAKGLSEKVCGVAENLKYGRGGKHDFVYLF